MTHQPPIPADSQSPYPIAEAPHDTVEDNETIAALKEMKEAKARWAPDATQLGVGAAIGVGSAAVVAALLYWRGNRKEPAKKK